MSAKAEAKMRREKVKESLRVTRELISELRKEFARSGKKRIPLSELSKRKVKG
jgi:hypothetical protein